MNNQLRILEKEFDNSKIRTVWDKEQEKYYISAVDIIAVLTESDNPRNYWKVLKHRLKQEGNESVTNCNQLKLKASDGKYYNTDVIDIEGMFRLIESIPSKKAEPIKIWLAHLGKERIDEEYDPEIAINRALETYRRKGYSDDWINQRLKAIDARKEFTDELKHKGIEKSNDFASLTNLLTKVWSGFSVKEYKEYKGLTKENLRDNMTNMELVLNMLAEVSSTEISKSKNDKGYSSAESSVIKGSSIAKNAKEQIEQETGKKVVTSERHINTKQLR